MHDRARHSVAVLLFLVFGPVLTAALLGWIAIRRSPIAIQWEKSQTRNATGIDFKIDSVEYLRWNYQKYDELVFPHPSTGTAMFTISDLKLRRMESKSSTTGSVLRLLLPFLADSETLCKLNSDSVSIVLNPKTLGNDVELLENLLLDQFGDRFSGHSRDVLFSFDKVDIQIPDSAAKNGITLTFLEGRFTSNGSRSELDCTFSLQDNPSRDPIRFVVKREKGVPDKPELTVELRSESTEVPIRFLALLFPALNSLGSESYFHGTVRGESSGANRWVVTFEDMGIGNADLGELRKQLTTYRLTGRLRLEIVSAKIAIIEGQTRFLDAVGWIQIEDGSISRELLARLVDDWQLSTTPNDELNPLHRNNLDPLKDIPPNGKEGIRFAEVMLYLYLGKDGVLLRPIPRDVKSGLIIALDQQGFYKYHLPKRVGSGQPIPYAALLTTFSPPDAEVVPLTPQTQGIVPHLP